MTKGLTSTIQVTNAAETEKLAAGLGARLRGGEVIELVSDLGGGKTTFTRGLAQGAGSTDRVASPTFTISKVYKTLRFNIHHFDFYRLPEAGLIAHELADLLGRDDVIVTEWGEAVDSILPADRLTVKLARSGEDERTITFTYPESLEYLVEGLC